MYEKDISLSLDKYPRRMSSEQVAEALRITLAALNSHLSRGTITIPFIKIGKNREFLKEHVTKFLESRYRAACEEVNSSLEQAS